MNRNPLRILLNIKVLIYLFVEHSPSFLLSTLISKTLMQWQLSVQHKDWTDNLSDIPFSKQRFNPPDYCPVAADNVNIFYCFWSVTKKLNVHFISGGHNSRQTKRIMSFLLFFHGVPTINKNYIHSLCISIQNLLEHMYEKIRIASVSFILAPWLLDDQFFVRKILTGLYTVWTLYRQVPCLNILGLVSKDKCAVLSECQTNLGEMLISPSDYFARGDIMHPENISTGKL